jgi:hypothetical protein
MGFDKTSESDSGESFWQAKINKLQIPESGYIKIINEGKLKSA